MRRIGLISGIHGNTVAFEAALADIGRRRVDELACLVDARAS
jgi:hypothetical protein